MRLHDSSLTLSSKIEQEILDKGFNYRDFGNAIGEEYRKYYLEIGKNESLSWDVLEKDAKESIELQYKIETNGEKSFSAFLSDYYST